MGHIHHGALILLHEMVTGVPEVSTEHDDVCKGCLLGKFAKESFQGVTPNLKVFLI